MTDMPARTTQRHSTGTAADTGAQLAAPGSAAPLPSPQYAGLFIEPDLPPLLDDAE